MTDNYSRDDECVVCGNEHLGDYPACSDCAMTVHFPHRQDCVHCFMQDIPSTPITGDDLDAMERESFLGRLAIDQPDTRPAFDWCEDDRCIGGVIVGTERICSDGTVDTYDQPCPTCSRDTTDNDIPY
jgi:hypothetical protein